MRPAKRITSTDVAREAGVSRTTVSFVLNGRPGQSIPEATRRRVLEAAERLDYRPHASARALAAGRSDVVLLSLSDLPVGTSVTRFVEQFAAALARDGLALVTHLAAASGRSLPDVCAAVDAVAVVALTPFDAEAAAALYRAGAEVVLGAGADVSAPQRYIGSLQAGHLAARGHQRVGYALPGQRAPERMAAERLRGVAEGCADAGLAAPVALRVGLDIASAARAVAGWTRESVTGVCAYNDETAIAVLAGMREHGLAAPAGLAVIGVDDIPVARLAAPALTTVAFDLGEAGRDLAEAVVAGLAGEDPRLPSLSSRPHVIERSST